MTIPNVSMRWAHRQSTCKFCSAKVLKATPVVVVFYWNKGSSTRSWNVKHYFHPDCWITQGLEWLKQNPFAPNKRWSNTTKKDPLTPEQSATRYKILKRHASLEQRRRKLTEPNTYTEAMIDAKLAQLILDIMEVGGVPKKWVT